MLSCQSDGGLQKNSDWPVTTQEAVAAAGGRRATEREREREREREVQGDRRRALRVNVGGQRKELVSAWVLSATSCLKQEDDMLDKGTVMRSSTTLKMYGSQ
ncbi:unnamed protein product [Leuciscus chuanchicus]